MFQLTDNADGKMSISPNEIPTGTPLSEATETEITLDRHAEETSTEDAGIPYSGAIGTEGIRSGTHFNASDTEEAPKMDPAMDGYLQQMTVDGTPVSKPSGDFN